MNVQNVQDVFNSIIEEHSELIAEENKEAKEVASTIDEFGKKDFFIFILRNFNLTTVTSWLRA